MTDFVEAAILFVAIADSPELYATHGDQPVRDAIVRRLAALEQDLAAQGGRQIRAAADGLICHFETAEAAVGAARHLSRVEPAASGPPLPLRIGVDLGKLISMRGELFGEALGIARRVAEAAAAGQVLITTATLERLSAQAAAQVRACRTMALQGGAAPAELHEVPAVASRDEPPLPGVLAAAFSRQLELAYGDRECRLQADDTPWVLGRQEDCELVVSSRHASRRHARIEHRRGRFVLIDQSANGTYVTLSQSAGSPEEICLRQEELVLRRAGVICLGQSLSQASAQRIRFRCE